MTSTSPVVPAMKYLPSRTAVLWVCAAVLAAPGFQQDEDEQKNTALLRVYPGVDQLVTRADALAEAGKYDQALEIYAEAQKHPNSLVPLETRGSTATRLVGVLEFCLRRIASWPKEGRAAARRHADPLAGLAFRAAQAARDPQALADVAFRYPHSSFADDALSTLGNLHVEAGRAQEAAAAYERLLALPDSEIPKPVVFARLAEALARHGRRDALDALAARVEREAPDGKVIFGDRESPLVEAIRTLARHAPAPVPSLLAPPSWEMLQGNPTGVRLAEPAELGMSQWKAPLEEARYQSDEDQWGGGFTDARPDSSYRPVVPAVSDGIVYFHTEYVAQAWNLYSQSSEPLWSHRVPVPPGQLLFEERLVHSTTVADGRVYVNLVTWLGQPEVQSSYIRVKYPFPKRALFALDAYTGRPLWRVGGIAGSERFEDGLSFSSPPTPAGGLLYAGAVRQAHPTDPFEHHVVCLDPASGRLLWSTFVASGGTEINLFGNSTRESVGSPVSVDADTVYYGTNHGAVAALDRTTGRLRWAGRYRQMPVRPTRRTDVQRGPLTWLPSAPIVARGRVLFSPTDSQHLFAFDAATGEKAWQRERKENRVLQGSDGTLVVLSGPDGVEWIDLSKDGKAVGSFEPSGLTVTGRPALTTEGIYLPTQEGLHRIPIFGSEAGYFVGQWRGTSMKGGNLVVAEGAIVVGGSKSVEVFLNRTAVDAVVEAELKKHPDRADIVYRAALRLLQSGKDERASELLVRVVELVSGSLRPADARLERAARKRLFAVSKAAGLKAREDGKHEAAAAAFQRAAKAAPDTASTVEATALLADAAQARGDASAAIGEYQRLLRESGAEHVGGSRVFDLARTAISNVILAGGRDPYKPFEEEAERRLAKAQADGSPEALVEIYRSFPNSIAAERAVLAAAEVLSRMGRPDEATSTLRLFMREFPASGRSLEAQAALVIELERTGRIAGAASVLRRMAASGAKWEVNDGGKRVSVGEFVESRLGRDEYKKVEGPPPELKLGATLTRAFVHTERDFPTGGAVLKPEGPALTGAKGLLLLNFGGAVKALDIATGTPVWKFVTDQPVRATFAHEEGLLLCSDTFVARVKPATGAVEWKHSPSATMKGFCRAGSMLFYLTTDPNAGGAASLVALDPARGTVAWTQGLTGVPMSVLVPGDDLVAAVTLSPSQILVFDPETGRASPPLQMSVRGSGLRIVSTRRNLVVVHSEEGGLQAFELPSGNRRWWNRLEDWSVTVLSSGPAGLLVGGKEGGRAAAMLLDLRSGKRLGVAETLDAVPMAPASMTDRAAAFAVRREGRGSGARAIDLADSRMKLTWSADGGRERLQSVPLLAPDRAVVLHLAADEEGKFVWAVELLDSTGRRLQNIKGDSPLERPPSIALANDSVVLFVDNKVEVYK